MLTTTLLIFLGVVSLAVAVAAIAYYNFPKAKSFMDEKIFSPIARLRVRDRKIKTEPILEETYDAPHQEESGKSVSEKSINPFLAFFAWYGGSDINLLRNLPSATIAKRAAFGFAMFISIILSAVIAGVVWSDINGVVYGVCVSVIWLFLMTSIERAIMIFIDHDNAKATKNKFKIIAVLAIRFTLIYAISSFNARMIEMQIFGSEIKTDIAQQRQIKLNHLNDSINAIVKNINAEKIALQKDYDSKNLAYQNVIADAQQKIDAMRDSMMTEQRLLDGEIEGIVGSGKLGYGPAAQSKQAALKRDSVTIMQMTARLDSSKKTMPQYLALQQALTDKNAGWIDADTRIAEVRAGQAIKAAELKSTKMDGFNDRYHSLERISADSPFMLLFFFLCFAFEALPVILKMMMGKDLLTDAIRIQIQQHEKDHHYDALIEQQKAKNAFELTYGDLKNQGIRQASTLVNEKTDSLYSLKNAHDEHLIQLSNNIDGVHNGVNRIPLDEESKDALRRQYVDEIVNKN